MVTLSNEYLERVWNYDDDELIFDVRVTRDFVELEPMKRNVVSVALRFYDTFGIVSPFQGILPKTVPCKGIKG